MITDAIIRLPFALVGVLVNLLPPMSSVSTGILDSFVTLREYLSMSLDVFPFMSHVYTIAGLFFLYHTGWFFFQFSTYVISLFVPTVKQYQR